MAFVNRDIINRDDYENILNLYGLTDFEVTNALNKIREETDGAINFSDLESHGVFRKIIGRFFSSRGKVKFSKEIFYQLAALFNTDNEFYLKYSVDDFLLKGPYRQNNRAFNFMRVHSALILGPPIFQLKDEILDLYYKDRVKVIEESSGLSTIVSSLIGSMLYDINPFISYFPPDQPNTAVDKFLKFKREHSNLREKIAIGAYLLANQNLSKEDLQYLISYWNRDKELKLWNYQLYDLSNEFEEKEIGEVNFILQLIYVADLLKEYKFM